jgi:hypothetical protein
MVRRRAIRGVRRGGMGCLGCFPFVLVVATTLGWFVRWHPLADLAAGYLIGRRHARRHVGQYGPGYPRPSSYYYPPPGYPPPAPSSPSPSRTPGALPAAHVRGNRCVAHGRRATSVQ